MNYKKLIKSRSLRVKLLSMLNWIPDKPMVKLQYRIKMKRSLDIKNPTRLTEKIQWLKLYYRDPLMAQCADKYEVRSFIESIGLANILNECYGVYNRVADIDWDSLPDSFVLKDTLGGGGNSVIIVRDKKQLDKEAACAQMRGWLSIDPKAKNVGREWVYNTGIPHRIIIEKFLAQDGAEAPLNDYKFFCFNGKVGFMYVMTDRKLGQSVSVGIFDRDFNKLPVLRTGDSDISIGTEKPKNFDRMLEYAEKIGSRFPHVRVDFYNVDGRIIFGETTFFGASGYMEFDPESFDAEMGEKLELPERNK